jgi:hypothetical protein
MNELSRRMMVTGGNVTGVTDQAGQPKAWSQRVRPSAGDRRAFARAADPQAGRARSARWRSSTRRWIVDCLGAPEQQRK